MPARADKLEQIAFDHQASREFALSLSRSILLVTARQRAAGGDFDYDRVAFAVVVRGPEKRLRLISIGALGGFPHIDLVAPSGRRVGVARVVPLGDGPLAELLVEDVWLHLELEPVELSDLPPTRGTTIFVVDGIGTKNATLARGVVLGALEDLEALKGLFVSDVPLHVGFPLLAGDGRLIGINYRAAPADSKRSIAVGMERLLAWLRPEGKAADPSGPPR